MNNIYKTLYELLLDNKSCVLATIIEARGSAPRGVGAKMIVCSDGQNIGTVGGGAVEMLSIKHAKKLLDEKVSDIQDYDLNPETSKIKTSGMLCGGNVKILFAYFDNKDNNIMDKLSHFIEAIGTNAKYDSDRLNVFACYDFNKTNNLLLFDWCDTFGLDKVWSCKYRDNRINKDPNHEFESVGGIHKIYKDSDSGVFIADKIQSPAYVYVFGAGHVAAATVPVLKHVGFNVVVCDSRTDLMKNSAFDFADEKIIEQYEECFNIVQIKNQDYVLVMTPAHISDYEVLIESLKTNAKYIGCLGSVKKSQTLYKKLIDEEGFTKSDTARICMPVGLKMNANTPEEIAISIVGQMVDVKNS